MRTSGILREMERAQEGGREETEDWGEGPSRLTLMDKGKGSCGGGDFTGGVKKQAVVTKTV